LATLNFKATLICKFDITVMTIPGVNQDPRYLQY
jgi:hypothetical protein